MNIIAKNRGNSIHCSCEFAVVCDSIVSDESIAFVLFKLKLSGTICMILNSLNVVVCLPKHAASWSLQLSGESESLPSWR